MLNLDKMKLLLLISTFLTACYCYAQTPEPGQAQLEMAIDLFNSEEYDDGLMILDIAISKGSINGLTYKGDLYYNGSGVTQDFNEAFNWYRQASENGNFEAMTKLGAMYADSLIVGKDYGDAVLFYEQLFHKGFHQSAALIGLAYYEGMGKVQNTDSAISWFQMGIEHNDAGSKYYLGKIKLSQEETDGLKLINEACSEGKAEACTYLGTLYFKGVNLDKDNDKAANFIEQGISLGDPAGYYHKAEMILEYALEGTKKEAVQLVEKAKKLGHPKKDCDFLRLRIYGEMHE